MKPSDDPVPQPSRGPDWVHPFVQVYATRDIGLGLRAIGLVPRGATVILFGGDHMTYREVLALPADMQDIPYQGEDDVFFGVRRREDIGPGERLNHSCMPNTGFVSEIRGVATTGSRHPSHCWRHRSPPSEPRASSYSCRRPSSRARPCMVECARRDCRPVDGLCDLLARVLRRDVPGRSPPCPSSTRRGRRDDDRQLARHRRVRLPGASSCRRVLLTLAGTMQFALQSGGMPAWGAILASQLGDDIAAFLKEPAVWAGAKGIAGWEERSGKTLGRSIVARLAPRRGEQRDASAGTPASGGIRPQGADVRGRHRAGSADSDHNDGHGDA